MKRIVQQLAEAFHLETRYESNLGEKMEVPEDSILQILEALSGESLETEAKIKRILNNCFDRKAQTPISIAWNRRLKIPAEVKTITIMQNNESVFESKIVSKQSSISLPPNINWGYYELQFTGKKKSYSSQFLIVAPARTELLSRRLIRSWGLFVPLYALKTNEDIGCGSLRELKILRQYVHDRGGKWVSCLPLLATDWETQAKDYSPYSPSSRLFWNEIFLDPDAAADHLGLPATKHLSKSSSRKWVNYPEVIAKKWPRLLKLSEEFYKRGFDKKKEFQSFLEAKPEIEAYAKHRASKGSPQRPHYYFQFELDRQLQSIRQESLSNKSAGLHLDYPVGVNSSGFDAAFFSHQFISGVSAGAPPDEFFEAGQNWGFSPLRPNELRSNRYEYFRKCLASQLRHAEILRIDHVMGLQRMFCIPMGRKPSEGAYLRFPTEELFAVLMTEAQKSKSFIVGEDLGTVHPDIRKQMKQRGVRRMWVLPFEAGENPKNVKEIPSDCLALLNTHDMPSFRALWTNSDLKLLKSLKVASSKRIEEIKSSRSKMKKAWSRYLNTEKASAASIRQLYRYILEILAKSRADFLQINTEDLWGELEPQNVPGTWKEYPNWSRRFRRDFEDWSANTSIKRLLQRITQWRQRSES